MTISFLFSSNRRNIVSALTELSTNKATDREIPAYILKKTKFSFRKLTKEKVLYLRYLGKPWKCLWILGLLIFSVLINHISCIIKMSDICNFTDNSTVFSPDRNLLNLKTDLMFNIKNLLHWFKINLENPGKC